jgi:hypothetical protein
LGPSIYGLRDGSRHSLLRPAIAIEARQNRKVERGLPANAEIARRPAIEPEAILVVSTTQGVRLSRQNALSRRLSRIEDPVRG